MISNNLNMNNNPMVPLNSINYNKKSTPGKFPLRTMQDSTQLLQRYGVVMMVLMEMMVEIMMMMIPMKSSLMVMLMATISPLREGIPLAEIYLPERSFSLGVFCPQRRRKSICGCSSRLRVP